MATISSTRTYHSFMCPSKCEYLSDKCVGTENSNDKSAWITSQTKMNQEKRLQQNISKLRSILSETISNLTRENNLKKGESVEVTLEIEVIKSEESTPTNSLVEVTIIQHINKHDSDNKLNKQPNKMLLKVEKDKLLIDDSFSQKQQNLSQRVISNEITVSNPFREDDDSQGDFHKKHIHRPLSCSRAKQFHKLKTISNLDTRRDFINILPEESHTENVSKGYKKVLQRQNRQEPTHVTSTAGALSKKVTKKGSLMKKISEIFVAPKKPSRSEVVKSALTALKNEMDNMQTALNEKENHRPRNKRDSFQIQNLGKLINNILFDVMATIGNDSKNEVKEEPSLPIHYESFFEPVAKTKRKQREKKIMNRKPSPSINKLYRSHSDTCCTTRDVDSRLKTSNSTSNCRANIPELQFEDVAKQSNKKRRKRSSHRDNLRCHKKSLKDKSGMLPVKDHPNLIQQRTPFSKSSLIQWNGRCVKVSKDVKSRIEMLIVNELENLALKEGMVYDVMPLSSTDDTSKCSNTVDKISSFRCELDISDKNVKKIMKKKRSLHKQVSVSNTQMDNNYPIHKRGTYTTITANRIQTAATGSKIRTKINRNNNRLHEVNTHDKLNNVGELEQNSLEIKYMNENVQNWSAESQTITFNCPEMKIPNQKLGYNCIGKEISSSKNSTFISTGFVKLISSDDSTWNKSDTATCKREILSQDLTETSLNVTSTATEKSNSKSSNDFNSSIEIELDIEDLEYILREAKRNHNADKVLIEAKCVGSLKRPRTLKHRVKNTQSYTNQLLTNAAKKLEKYAKTKGRKKGTQY